MSYGNGVDQLERSEAGLKSPFSPGLRPAIYVVNCPLPASRISWPGQQSKCVAEV